MEPAVVKTVSYFKVSAVMLSWANSLVMKESFFHVVMKKQKAKFKSQKSGVILFIFQI